MLKPEEVIGVEFGLPDLSTWGDAMLLPFVAKKLCHPTVVWINERWLLERGINVLDPSARKRTLNWLIDQFAYCVPADGDPAGAYLDAEKVLKADRYGGSGIVPHGGSGRTGTLGRFQIKGIGVTPLVGTVPQGSYATGCAWLEEAIREALYGEVAEAEFPHSGVPVIAVIDTGMNHRRPDGECGERRALIIRPAVMRPAHFERAPMFSATDFYRQHSSGDDVKRVREAISRFREQTPPQGASGADPASLPELLVRVAEQIAFGRVHRLCHGGYLTSNLTMRGELLDFGSFRSVPDWSRAFSQDNMPGFGSEMLFLKSAARSLVFHFNKYRSPSEPVLREIDVLATAELALQSRFERECLRLWGAVDIDDPCLRGEILDAMRRYYNLQQRTNISYERGSVSVRPWISAALPERLSNPSASVRLTAEDALIERVSSALNAHFGAFEDANAAIELALSTARRLLRPRPSLYREELQRSLYDLIGGQNAAEIPSPESVSETIRARLSSGRRHWPRLPCEYAVLAQVTWGYSSALFCQNVHTSSYYLWIEASRCGVAIGVFGRTFSVTELAPWCIALDDRRWNGVVPATADGRSALALPPLNEVAFPVMAYWYERQLGCDPTNLDEVGGCIYS